jgi:hypothetical protein
MGGGGVGEASSYIVSVIPKKVNFMHKTLNQDLNMSALQHNRANSLQKNTLTFKQSPSQSTSKANGKSTNQNSVY